MFMTYKKLVAAGACKDQAILFKQLFPNGVQITAEICVEHADKFDFSWAARLLPDPQRCEYERVKTTARAEFRRIKLHAWAECIRVKTTAHAIAISNAEYDRIKESAWAEYDRIEESAQAEYDRTKASAFGTLAETVE